VFRVHKLLVGGDHPACQVPKNCVKPVREGYLIVLVIPGQPPVYERRGAGHIVPSPMRQEGAMAATSSGLPQPSERYNCLTTHLASPGRSRGFLLIGGFDGSGGDIVDGDPGGAQFDRGGCASSSLPRLCSRSTT